MSSWMLSLGQPQPTVRKVGNHSFIWGPYKDELEHETLSQKYYISMQDFLSKWWSVIYKSLCQSISELMNEFDGDGDKQKKQSEDVNSNFKKR